MLHQDIGLNFHHHHHCASSQTSLDDGLSRNHGHYPALMKPPLQASLLSFQPPSLLQHEYRYHLIVSILASRLVGRAVGKRQFFIRCRFALLAANLETFLILLASVSFPYPRQSTQGYQVCLKEP